MEISLHAILGTRAPKTMRLIGYMGNQRVIVLINIGSTHSFIDPNVARRTKPPMLGNQSMTVMVANGDCLPCQDCCMTVLFILQGNKFYTTLYLLTLGGCDMVSGVNWLCTLGPILWDFSSLTMGFKWRDLSIKL